MCPNWNHLFPKHSSVLFLPVLMIMLGSCDMHIPYREKFSVKYLTSELMQSRLLTSFRKSWKNCHLQLLKGEIHFSCYPNCNLNKRMWTEVGWLSGKYDDDNLKPGIILLCILISE